MVKWVRAVNGQAPALGSSSLTHKLKKLRAAA